MATFLDPAGSSGANDGSSWDDAVGSLADAVVLTGSGEEIWIKAGTLELSTTVNIAGEEIYGGFDVNLTGTDGDKDDRDLVNDITIIDADSTVRALETTSANWVLSGIRFENCGGSEDGGALYADSNGTISQCYFYNCVVAAGYDGGAIKIDTSSVTALTISLCTFDSCSCNIAVGDYGGGVSATDCSGVSISSCTFTGCVSGGGGAIHTSGTQSDLSVTGCYFYNCEGLHGGALRLSGTSGTFYECYFDGNTGDYGGAIYISNSSSPHWIFKSCLFSNCDADTNGGVINIIADTVIFNRCTLADCTAASNNGAICRAGGTVYFYNSIAWDNGSAPISSGCTVERSDVDGGYTGTGNINEDPVFAGADHYYPYYINAITGCVDSADSGLTGYPDADITGASEFDEPTAANYETTFGDMGCYEFQGIIIPGTMPYDHYKLTLGASGSHPMNFFIPTVSHYGPASWSGGSIDRQRLKVGSEISVDSDSIMTENWFSDFFQNTRQIVRVSADVSGPLYTEDFNEIYQSYSSYLGTFGGSPHGIPFASDKYRVTNLPAVSVLLYKVTSDLSYGESGYVYNIYFEEYPYELENFDDDDCSGAINNSATNLYDPDVPLSAFHVRETTLMLNRTIFDNRTIAVVPVYGDYSWPVVVV
jgi:hypothetical protein